MFDFQLKVGNVSMRFIRDETVFSLPTITNIWSASSLFFSSALGTRLFHSF
jgi:hypothetical protein